MKVLLINYEFPPIGGGGANATYYLLKEFSSIPDLEIDLVTSAWKNPGVEKFSPRINIHKLEVHKKQLHFWTHREIIEYIIKALAYSKRLSRRNPPDICHAFFGFPSGLITFWLRGKFPYIVSLRGSDVPGFNNRFSLEYVFLTPLFKKIWSHSRRVIANSRGLKSLAQKTAPDQAIEVIFNGIDVEEFKPRPNQTAGARQFNLIVVSRLIERKGIDFLIRAMPEILRAEPAVTLTVIGEGNMEQALKSLAESLGLSDKVRFMGFQDHSRMPEHYQNADIFVLPSKNEGMSNTVLEAMACGLPIITTDTGGTNELIRDNGLIIPKEDSGAISRAVLKLLTEPGLREEMGKNSRQISLEFSWHSQAMKYWKIYQETADRD